MLVKPGRRSELVTLQAGKPEKRTRSQRIQEEWERREGRVVPASEGPTGFLHMSLKLGAWERRRRRRHWFSAEPRTSAGTRSVLSDRFTFMKLPIKIHEEMPLTLKIQTKQRFRKLEEANTTQWVFQIVISPSLALFPHQQFLHPMKMLPFDTY